MSKEVKRWVSGKPVGGEKSHVWEISAYQGVFAMKPACRTTRTLYVKDEPSSPTTDRSVAFRILFETKRDGRPACGACLQTGRAVIGERAITHG